MTKQREQSRYYVLSDKSTGNKIIDYKYGLS